MGVVSDAEILNVLIRLEIQALWGIVMQRFLFLVPGNFGRVLDANMVQSRLRALEKGRDFDCSDMP